MVMLFLIVVDQGSQHMESLMFHCTNGIVHWYPNVDWSSLEEELDMVILTFLTDKPFVHIRVGRFNDKDS